MKDTKSSAMRNAHNVTMGPVNPNFPPKSILSREASPKKEIIRDKLDIIDDTNDPMTLEGISGMVVIGPNVDQSYDNKLSSTLQPNMEGVEDLIVYDEEDFEQFNSDLNKGDSAIRSDEGGSMPTSDHEGSREAT